MDEDGYEKGACGHTKAFSNVSERMLEGFLTTLDKQYSQVIANSSHTFCSLHGLLSLCCFVSLNATICFSLLWTSAVVVLATLASCLTCPLAAFAPAGYLFCFASRLRSVVVGNRFLCLDSVSLNNFSDPHPSHQGKPFSVFEVSICICL